METYPSRGCWRGPFSPLTGGGETCLTGTFERADVTIWTQPASFHDRSQRRMLVACPWVAHLSPTQWPHWWATQMFTSCPNLHPCLYLAIKLHWDLSFAIYIYPPPLPFRPAWRKVEFHMPPKCFLGLPGEAAASSSAKLRPWVRNTICSPCGFCCCLEVCLCKLSGSGQPVAIGKYGQSSAHQAPKTDWGTLTQPQVPPRSQQAAILLLWTRSVYPRFLWRKLALSLLTCEAKDELNIHQNRDQLNTGWTLLCETLRE